MKECPVCGNRDIYVDQNGNAQCLRCGYTKRRVQRPEYGKRIFYIKKIGGR